MIAISKEEKEVISKELPYAHIVRTMKQKSKRHHYYCEESKKVMELLNQMRSKQRAGASIGDSKEG